MQSTLFWVQGLASGRLAVVTRPDPAFGLAQQMQALRAAGLDALVSMLREAEVMCLGLAGEAQAAAAAGLAFHHLPTDDFGVPASLDDAGALVTSMASEVAAGRTVGVHCHAGRGRSPLFAAVVLVRLGEAPEAAINLVSQARGRRIPETDAQRQWVIDFAAWCRKSPL